MGQCECGHEHSGKFCPECGKAGQSGESVQSGSESSGQSNATGSATNPEKRDDLLPVSSKGEESGKTPEPTPKVRRRSGPRVVRVTAAKTPPAKAAPAKGSQTSVGTKKIVKKVLPGKSKTRSPAVTERVKTNIEMKEDREKQEKKKTGGHSMREKVANASGWRWM